MEMVKGKPPSVDRREHRNLFMPRMISVVSRVGSAGDISFRRGIIFPGDHFGRSATVHLNQPLPEVGEILFSVHWNSRFRYDCKRHYNEHNTKPSPQQLSSSHCHNSFQTKPKLRTLKSPKIKNK